MTNRVNVFAGAHFDRLGHRRSDQEWISRCLQSGQTSCLAVWKDRNLVQTEPEQRAVFLPPDRLPAELHKEIILLGEFSGKVCFAVDLGEEDVVPSMPVGEFQDLRTVGLLFPNDQSALLAYAQAMVLWHRRHRFCGRCGTASNSFDTGHERRCSSSACDQVIFPRIDPAIIVLIEHDGNALLGRQPSWPAGVYSTIAGFVEPGESLEDAVCREAMEETGVEIGKVRYHSSQPWPFPSSLMLGFHAYANSTVISLHDQELEDARWFSRSDLERRLRDRKMRVPPQLSISSRLIAHWFDEQKPGRLADLVANLS
ncbi:MAG: NAD(+) diphosphatase [Gammaproteobacteria bacterium]|nr:NAD(+) diphosphatase [Gammaproteobacteria bacterium]